MQFKHTIEVKSKLKKLKEYNFEIFDKDLEKIKQATFDKPHIFGNCFCIQAGYMDKGKINIIRFTSSNTFEEIGE